MAEATQLPRAFVALDEASFRRCERPRERSEQGDLISSSAQRSAAEATIR
ncbi:MAG: hypothetical protein H6738_19190 [Alphaproteobacteria bacterium]|nr:hypothetical protein [Alphaproteobacteria bacterium]